jgi:predicted nucleotidyltransferase component of viral defense system
MEFDGVKVDVVKYPYPWINPVVREQDIRLASEQDICAMKLAAITKRGLKKDFIDIYFLLKEYSLQRLFEFFHRKYPESETYMTVKSLTYFTDADQSEMPVLLKDKSTTWEQVKETLHQAVKSVI